MKNKIIAKDRQHLDYLIAEEIKLSGPKCNLNHIDIRLVKELHYLFSETGFNGDISEWDTSQVTEMSSMFCMTVFNGDISKWDVSKVENMLDMFYVSDFNGDLTNWKPYSLQKLGNAFLDCPAQPPYWANYETQEARVKAIDSYVLHNELNLDLSLNNNESLNKKIKI